MRIFICANKEKKWLGGEIFFDPFDSMEGEETKRERGILHHPHTAREKEVGQQEWEKFGDLRLKTILLYYAKARWH